MKRWVRRVRGALGMGLTWATAWIPVGAVTGWLTGVVLGFPLAGIAVNYSVMFGVLGFLGGVIFSTVLSIAEGRRRFDELSLPRFMAWGGVGGLALGGFAVAIGLVGLSFSGFGFVAVGVSTLLGAGSAAGTLAIAGAAGPDVLLEASEDAEGASLAGTGVRKVRGATYS